MAFFTLSPLNRRRLRNFRSNRRAVWSLWIFGTLFFLSLFAEFLANDRPLLVSPLHRILMSDWRVELLTGEPRALIAARDLVNDRDIVRQRGGWVTYVHILFDRHQIVYAEGAESESLLSLIHI